jgi:hypothetical protein
MPATSDKQERFMQAVAHNPKFAKKVGVKQKVGKEFVGMADGGEVEKPRAKSGNTAYIESIIDEATGEAALRRAPKALPPGTLSKGELTAAEKAKRAKGPPEEMLRRHESRFAKGGSIDGCAIRGKTKALRR